MSRWSFLRDESGAPPLDSPASDADVLPISGPSAGADWRVRTDVHENDRVTDLKLYGFRTAGSSHASPQVLRTVIGWLYHNKLTVEEVHASGEHERITELGGQIVQLQG